LLEILILLNKIDENIFLFEIFEKR